MLYIIIFPPPLSYMLPMLWVTTPDLNMQASCSLLVCNACLYCCVLALLALRRADRNEGYSWIAKNKKAKLFSIPSRRRCPYGHPENHFRSYSTKSLVLKLSAHMRALTASKDQYKLKSSQHVCVNLNIFATVVP